MCIKVADSSQKYDGTQYNLSAIVFKTCMVNQAIRQWSAFNFYETVFAKYPSPDFKNAETFPGLIHQQIITLGCRNLHHHSGTKDFALVNIPINLKLLGPPKLYFIICALKQQDCNSNKNIYSILWFTLLHVYTGTKNTQSASPAHVNSTPGNKVCCLTVTLRCIKNELPREDLNFRNYPWELAGANSRQIIFVIFLFQNAIKACLEQTALPSTTLIFLFWLTLKTFDQNSVICTVQQTPKQPLKQRKPISSCPLSNFQPR